MEIIKKKLLREKRSGTYGCPNYIDPQMGNDLLNSQGINADEETVMLFTEIIENFGLELIKEKKGKLTKLALFEIVNELNFK